MSEPAQPGAIGFHPLYRQVKDRLVGRMVSRAWPPGHLLPSEIELAGELGVSQGTVRKALDELAAERLLTRRQGRGTFVTEHDDARILFQFFRLTADDGKRIFPESRTINVAVGAANAEEREALRLPVRSDVVRIRRVRLLAGRPLIAERISVPQALFPGIEKGDLPNNIYTLYAERFGVPIARAEEKLKAVALGAADAKLLGAPAGTPALLIDRVAIALDGRPVERRASLCLTDNFHYHSGLT